MEKKSWIIEEQFVGWGHATVWAETEEEALSLYNRGHYPDSDYVMDDMFYDFEFVEIKEAS